MLKYITLFTIVLLVHLVTATPANINNSRMSGMDRMNYPQLVDCIHLHRCLIAKDLNPLCASDGKTYLNTSSFYCMQKCVKHRGEDLTIMYRGYCENDIRF